MENYRNVVEVVAQGNNRNVVNVADENRKTIEMC